MGISSDNFPQQYTVGTPMDYLTTFIHLIMTVTKALIITFETIQFHLRTSHLVRFLALVTKMLAHMTDLQCSFLQIRYNIAQSRHNI